MSDRHEDDDDDSPTPPLLIVVGDLHGWLKKAQQLWQRLEAHCGADFATARVVWLGDYVDRGPDPAGVLSWLVALPAAHPGQQHRFIAGNHELALCTFLGLWPVDPAEADAAAAAYEPPRGGEAPLYAGPGAAGMHLQGRRYANAGPICTYDSQSTYASYGVGYGDRAGLQAAVPAAVQAFLAGLRWSYGCALPQPGCCDVGEPAERLLAVHAGLVSAELLGPQLARMRARGLDRGAVPQLSGRADVLRAHPELAARRTLLASGHHFTVSQARGVWSRALLRRHLAIASRRACQQPCLRRSPRPLPFLVVTPCVCFPQTDWRLVLDSGGGRPGKRLTAVVFPGRTHVASDGDDEARPAGE